MSKFPQFKGLVAPTFTPFSDDFSVNYDAIEPYAKHLKSKGIPAVLINGTSGEGMILTTDERKRLTSKWAAVCKKLDILLMVQISGCSFPDVVDHAKQAALLKVDGVLCLPELYFKPKTIEKLVDYLRDISAHCPDIPLYYYHIPVLTQVDLPMASFMKLARESIPSFAGIKFSSGDLEKAIPCLKHGHVFIGPNTIFIGALALNFTNAIMTSLNVNPEVSLKILDLMNKGNLAEAREQQSILNEFLESTLRTGNGEWVPSMKKAFNDKFMELNLGPTRKPL